jgi:hypothetical protein
LHTTSRNRSLYSIRLNTNTCRRPLRDSAATVSCWRAAGHCNYLHIRSPRWRCTYATMAAVQQGHYFAEDRWFDCSSFRRERSCTRVLVTIRFVDCFNSVSIISMRCRKLVQRYCKGVYVPIIWVSSTMACAAVSAHFFVPQQHAMLILCSQL